MNLESGNVPTLDNYQAAEYARASEGFEKEHASTSYPRNVADDRARFHTARTEQRNPITIRVPPVAPDHDECEIQAALDDLRKLVVQEVGDAVDGFETERVQHATESGNLDWVVLVVNLHGMNRQQRHRLSEALLDHLADSESEDVRRRVTVTIR